MSSKNFPLRSVAVEFEEMIQDHRDWCLSVLCDHAKNSDERDEVVEILTSYLTYDELKAATDEVLDASWKKQTKQLRKRPNKKSGKKSGKTSKRSKTRKKQS